MSGVARIELTYLAGCPNADPARQLLKDCLAQLGLRWEIRETEGDCPSPTIRVDGRDVVTDTLVSPTSATAASCRVDLPTSEVTLLALRRARDAHPTAVAGASCPSRSGRAARIVVWSAAVLTLAAGLLTVAEGVLG
ncbi:MAG: hypothetical protein H0V92_11095 [Pseudonocardiales bacterium]|nr:hypothetical protein [Pseudonocardiales bacterium]